jgi:hypothetical protein
MDAIALHYRCGKIRFWIRKECAFCPQTMAAWMLTHTARAAVCNETLEHTTLCNNTGRKRVWRVDNRVEVSRAIWFVLPSGSIFDRDKGIL